MASVIRFTHVVAPDGAVVLRSLRGVGVTVAAVARHHRGALVPGVPYALVRGAKRPGGAAVSSHAGTLVHDGTAVHVSGVHERDARAIRLAAGVAGAPVHVGVDTRNPTG